MQDQGLIAKMREMGHISKRIMVEGADSESFPEGGSQ